jgi:hypothetical protein
MLVLLLSCDNQKISKDPISTYEVPQIHVEALTHLQQQRRFFLDLLGVFPQQKDIQEILQSQRGHDESSIITKNIWVQENLQKDEHRERLTHLFTEWLLTRVDAFNTTYRSYDLPQSKGFVFRRSIGEEPTRLMSYIGSQNIDFREILTANYTLSNDLLVDIWPLERVESTDDTAQWFQTKYTDGRPSGGVLMTNGLWWRYYTTPNNNNRSRAAALMNLFLCENLLLRPILFQATALLEGDEINNVIQTDAACIGCHNTLDPLASAFFGFWWFDIYDRGELSRYHPEREFLGEESNYLDTPMAYFGQPMYTPAELGEFVAQDPRFLSCTVEKTTQLLWQRNIKPTDQTKLAHFRNRFSESDLSYQDLLKTIMTDEIFIAAHIETEENRYLLQPHQLESTFYALTGFLWEENSQPLLQSDNGGYRQLLGGVDGREITQPVRNPTLSRQLVIKRLAQNSSSYWVEHNWQNVEERGYVFLDTPLEQLDETQQKDLFTKWIVRSTSIEPSTEDITSLMELFETIEQEYDTQTAYKTVISVILRSVDLWSY